jgi:pimeloyl-ACP methyl ester carboxylesterase
VLAGFLAEQDFGRPHVAGNSLGGWVALELARLGRARSVTALCPAGFWRRRQGPLDPRRRRALAAARPLVPLAFALPGVREKVLSGVMAHPERLSYRAATRIANAYAAGPGYVDVQTAMRAGRLEDGEGIDVPVTIAWAEHDRLVGPERVALRPTRTVVLRDAGHVPMWDVPDQITRLILEDALAARASRAAAE